MFAIEIEPTDKSKANQKYYGADGSPIMNYGRQLVEAFNDNGTALNVDVDVADITRPLLSIFEMISKHNRVVYDEGEPYILHKPTSEKMPLRREGKLFFLDLWARVPRKLPAHPFVRQVA